MFETVIGQKEPISFLTSLKEAGRVGPPFIFYGPSQVGKSFVARHLFRSLVCESSSYTDFCECNTCSRFNSGDFLDYIELAPNDKGTIPIDSVREAIRFFSFKARERRWKVALIKRAECLPQGVSDTFLKVLEEPHPQMLLILTTSNISRISSTIRSRCILVRFGFLSFQDLRQLAGSHFSDLDLYLMGGSYRPSISTSTLFYFKRAFRLEQEDPGLDEVNKEALELEMLYLLGQLSYAARGNVVSLGRIAFSFADASKLSESILVLEEGLGSLRAGVKPYLVLKLVELSLMSIMSGKK